uniref:Uncharacterized protein n=1 Tax=Euplotes crassus TaxID=5936 RepID=A0A7S3P0Z0_EUPCR|mmetsp:Transcript_4021/g.3798  ORF Transcript_4021/g.3798 Transcript_4021/m.3798 type:complete len:139 (+) Transcript_4021:54-470(+)
MDMQFIIDTACIKPADATLTETKVKKNERFENNLIKSEANDSVLRDKSHSNALNSTTETKNAPQNIFLNEEAYPKIEYIKYMNYQTCHEIEDRDLIPTDPSKVIAPDLLNPFGRTNGDFLNLKLYKNAARPSDKIKSI